MVNVLGKNAEHDGIGSRGAVQVLVISDKVFRKGLLGKEIPPLF